MLPCTVSRGFQSKDPPRSGSANEILAVTRENVPERALYFLQHRWRLLDYVRTPLGASDQGLCGELVRESADFGLVEVRRKVGTRSDGTTFEPPLRRRRSCAVLATTRMGERLPRQLVWTRLESLVGIRAREDCLPTIGTSATRPEGIISGRYGAGWAHPGGDDPTAFGTCQLSVLIAAAARRCTTRYPSSFAADRARSSILRARSRSSGASRSASIRPHWRSVRAP